MTRKPADTRWPALVIAAMAVLAIGLGLAITGGPGQGRMERRDEIRHQDIARLSAQVECLAQATGVLPESLNPTPLCPGEIRLADPYTGAPYRFEPLSHRAYRLCAGFETDLALRAHWGPVNVDTETGCIHFSLADRTLPHRTLPDRG